MVNLSHVRIILENPQSAKNIGSVCRAMKNMGFSKLYIAGSIPEDFEKAAVTAIHASDILEQAVITESVEKALEGTVYSAAISRRRGKKRKYFSISPENLADAVLPLCTAEEEAGSTESRIAIVFGNEVSGLNEHDLGLCNTAVRIQSSDLFPSLNLSHAVQLITYVIYHEALKEKEFKGYRPINREELEVLTSEIAGNLKNIGFFKQVDDSDMKSFFRDIFARAGVSAGEAKRLKNIFSKIEGLSKN